MFAADRPHSFSRSVLHLLGHVAGTTVIYLSIVVFGWLISLAIHSLHGVHQFSEEILLLFTRFELYLGYADLFLFALFLVAGALRFLRDLWELQMKNELIGAFVEGFKDSFRLAAWLLRGVASVVTAFAWRSSAHSKSAKQG